MPFKALVSMSASSVFCCSRDRLFVGVTVLSSGGPDILEGGFGNDGIFGAQGQHTVVAAALPDVSARDLSAWLGLTPKPHSSGGKERLGEKPLKVVAIALANRMARQIWAILRTGEAWRVA